MDDLWWRLVDAVRDARLRFERWMTLTRHASYAAAACRIATGLAVIGLLLSNFSTRSLWVGQASVWAEPARRSSSFPELALLRGVSDDVLFVVYVVTLLAAFAFVIGWRTKAANVVTYVGFIAIVAQNPVVGVQADNLLRLTLLWLLLMRTSDHWSLDARRRARVARGDVDQRSSDDVLPPWLSNSLHNTGLVALGAQTIIAYTAAGLAKVGQAEWQHGTALYTTLQLPESRPYPALSDLVSSNQVVLAGLTYAVLLSQLFFAPLLLSRISRRVVLVVSILVAFVFAVLFAAPWAQLAVVAVTLLFVSDDRWLRLEDAVLERLDPMAERVVDPIVDKLDEWRDRIKVNRKPRTD